MSRPSHRTLRLGSTSSTVGLNCIGRPPGGSNLIASLVPSTNSPSARVMNGFHSW